MTGMAGEEIAKKLREKEEMHRKKLIEKMNEYAKNHSWLYVFKLVRKMKPSNSISYDDIDFMLKYAKERI